MSGSDGSVTVKITADTAGFAGPVSQATVSAQAFAAALQAAGGNMRKITPDMLGVGTAATTAAKAVDDVAVKTASATVNFQGIINAATGADRAFKSAADSASVFNRALDPSPLQKMNALMKETGPAAESAHGGMAGITREFLVLIHETMTDNYRRIPGSLVVLAERSGALTSIIGTLAASFTPLGIAGAAGVGVVALAFVALALRAHEATAAINEAMNAASFGGRDPVEAKNQTIEYAAALQKTGIMGSAAAHQVASAISQLPNVTAEAKAKIAEQAPAMYLSLGKDAEKTGEAFAKMYETPASLYKFLEANNYLTAKVQSAWAAAATGPEKMVVGYDAINARLVPMSDQFSKVTAAAKENLQEALLYPEAMGSAAMMTAGQKAPVFEPPQGLGNFQPGTKAADPGQEADRKATDAVNTPEKEKAALLATLATETRDLQAAQSANDAAGVAGAQNAIAATQRQIDNLKTLGDPSWSQKVMEGWDLIRDKISAAGTSNKQVAEDTAKAEIAYYTQVAAQAGITEAQKTSALATASTARRALMRDELGAAETASKAAATAARVAAREDLETKLASLTAQQAADKGNFALVLELEDQKLALLAAAGAKYTAAYQTELGRRATMERENAAQIVQMKIEALAATRAQDAQDIAENKATLAEQVAGRQISKQQELAAELAFMDAKHDAELADAEALLATLDKQTEAYRRMYDQIELLKKTFATKDAVVNTQIEQDLTAKWQAATAPIASAFDSSMNGVIQGTTTLSAAVGKMAQSIVLSYADMAAKRLISVTTTALQEVFVTKAAQTEQTGAVVAGAAAQNAAKSAGAATGMATEVATGTASIMNAAKTAAAGAYAAVAGIPIVGPVLAPAAAAAAFVAVGAFDSLTGLATGAYDIPSNMAANLHAGEMVIPQNFADGIRGAMSGGGGGGQTLNYSPTIHGAGSAATSSQMRAQSQAFKSYMWHATRNGGLTMPGRG